MSYNQSTLPKRYFAAANSYAGFKSCFDEIFNPYEFDRIYVLKGGPGTGKNSLMRSLKSDYSDKECDIDEILCSSDPASLDGIIIKRKQKKVAVLDGTAPHTRDMAIPGAADELINLGEFWDKEWLISYRKKIEELQKEKARAYKTAYSYLNLAGSANSLVKAALDQHFDNNKGKNLAEMIFAELSADDTYTVQERIISSFGKSGESTINILHGGIKKTFRISGRRNNVQAFIKLCSSYLREKGISHMLFPNVLCSEEYDGILVDDYLLIASDVGEISADEISNAHLTTLENIKKGEQIHSESLDEAKRWFAIASDLHFRLEEIYSSAMNFDKINSIYSSTRIEIDNILEISR